MITGIFFRCQIIIIIFLIMMSRWTGVCYLVSATVGKYLLTLPGGQQPSLAPCHCHQYMANIVIDIATSIGNMSNIVIILVEYCYLQYQYYLIIIGNSE